MSDHDLLIRLDEKMDTVIDALDEGKKQFKELGERVDCEEKWTVRMKTGVGIIAFILTVFGAKIFL